MARAGLEPGTAGLQVRRADRSATLAPRVCQKTFFRTSEALRHQQKFYDFRWFSLVFQDSDRERPC